MRPGLLLSLILMLTAFLSAQTTGPNSSSTSSPTASSSPGAAQSSMPPGANDLPLMPWPSSLQRGTGALPIDVNFRVGFSGYKEPRLDRAVDRFMSTLSRKTAILFNYSDAPKTVLTIDCAGPSAEVQKLGEDESYKLVIDSNGARLNAANPLGVLRGLQTFIQLVQVTPEGNFAASAVTIDDKPRFPWRGLMIDVGRHFMPLDVIRRNLDGMEAVKLNVFHWHLSEDQGFRVESKKYPKLQQLGSDGMYYTQDEIKQTIAYARDRGIRVVPEFDMPGHSTAWFVGYPEISSGPGPYRIERHWGIFDPAMDPTRDSTYEFLDGLIGEMAGLFPDAYFHIGGDEVNGKAWAANASIQAFMRAHKLKDANDLQTYFSQRVLPIVQKHGKIVEGWDEVLHPGVPKDIVIQSWRGQKSLADAARQGYSGLLSTGYYLDLMQSAAQHYAVDPMEGATSSLTEEQRKHILGGEACEWAEFVTPNMIDLRIWPRTAAIAERFWSPQDVKDVDSMYSRMYRVSDDLAAAGLHHHSDFTNQVRRLANGGDATPVAVLANIVEPVKEYARGQLQEYTSATPLNRLIDTARAESRSGREFAGLADKIISAKASPEELAKAKDMLAMWSANDAKLQPVVAHSGLLAETAQLSKNVSAAAAIGLEALGYIANGNAPSGWADQQMSVLKSAEPEQAGLLNMLVAPVEKLVMAVKK